MRFSIFDFIKFFLVFFVIIIHFNFPGKTGEFIMPTMRCAVPTFFCISGYLFYNRLSVANVVKTLKRITVILLYSVFLYTCIKALTSTNITDLYNSLINKKDLLRGAVTNSNFDFLAPQLWYLQAYIYLLTLIIISIKSRSLSLLKRSVPILLLFCIVYNYTKAINIDFLINNNLPSGILVTRNFLFTSLPFFMIGYLIAESKRSILISNKLLIISLFISPIIVFLEYYLIGECELYFTNILQVILIMIIGNREKNRSINPYLEKIGRDHSLNIYIIHFALIPLIEYFFIYKVIYNIAPVILLLLSIIVSIIIEKAKSLLFPLFENKSTRI